MHMMRASTIATSSTATMLASTAVVMVRTVLMSGPGEKRKRGEEAIFQYMESN